MLQRIVTRIALPAVLAAALAAVPVAAAPADNILVDLDHAKIMKLPEKIQTIVVGNPMIADVTVQKNGIMIVTGKSYGVTNLIALDAAGNLVVEANIRVQAGGDALVTVHRGMDRESYSCAPACQPTLLLGDAQKHFTDVSGQANARNALAGQK